jgi:transcriptional regulator NrdR family protein
MDTYSVLPVEIQTIARQIKETLAKREKDSAPKLTVRYERGNLSGLKITFADRREGYIYKNREPRVADFSTKELREIVRQFKSKILAMSAEDITPNQRELLVGLEKALSERPTEKPNVTPTASSVCKNLRAIMNRNSHSDANVVVTLPGDQCEKITIYQGIVEHCCKDLSNNELREVVRQIRNQIVAMSEDDIPVTWIEALTEFEETLKVREQ